MGIKLEEIEKFAGLFINFLDTNFIDSVYNLHRLSERKSRFPITVESFFLVTPKPASKESGSPYSISYNIEGRGKPIEIIVDPYAPNCTSFLIKANKTVYGYDVLGLDQEKQNYQMQKRIEGHDFGEVRKELRSLTTATR